MKVFNAYLIVIRFLMAVLNIQRHDIETVIIKAVNETFWSRIGLILHDKKALAETTSTLSPRNAQCIH